MAVAFALLAGCGGNVRFREVVVTFDRTAGEAARARVLQACAGVPHTSPEPRPSSALRSTQANDVRFRVDDASDRELAALYACLQRDPAVRGVSIPGM